MRVEAREIAMANAAELTVAGRAAIAQGDPVFDLSAVARCDSSAVAMLLDWQREAAARGVKLQVTGIPSGLVSLAEVYGVTALLPALPPNV
ncbi:MAG TPA: STAS domain-containing protein [Burkholderiaceae bacterium]|nr:STAS domain-containing protein [Burkholderiaceae bacterium]